MVAGKLNEHFNYWTSNRTLVAQNTIRPHPPLILPESWPSHCTPLHPLPTISAAGSLDAGAVAGDRKTVAWNQDLDACMDASHIYIAEMIIIVTAVRLWFGLTSTVSSAHTVAWDIQVEEVVCNL